MKPHLTTLFIILFVTNGICQKNAGLIEALNTIIKPITTLNPEDGYDDVLFLKEALKGAAIIGIGESTHGTVLYDTYRWRLIRFLITEMGLKAIVDESDVIATEYIDAYINNQTDSLKLIGNTRPIIMNKEGLDWLRKFNQNKPISERVHIYGAEVRGFSNIIGKIKTLIPITEEKDNQVFRKFSDNAGVSFGNLSKNDFQNLENIINRLSINNRNNEQVYYLSLLQQVADFGYKDLFTKQGFKTRDNYMMENIKSVVDKTPNKKAIILAHNGHVQKTKFGTLPSLGYFLNEFYQEKYRVIATDFNEGDVIVYNMKSGEYIRQYFNGVDDSKAIEYYFKQCKYTNFIVPVSDALKNPVTKPFITKKIKMLRNLGATGTIISYKLRMADNYDFIAFINNTLE